VASSPNKNFLAQNFPLLSEKKVYHLPPKMVISFLFGGRVIMTIEITVCSA
jgi:hypothetical protein